MSKLLRLTPLVWLCLLLAGTHPAAATDEHGFEIQTLNQHVFALVGPLTDRNPENLGNNATFGVIVTDAGVVLIDSGASYRGAQRIHQAIKSLSDQPVRIVVNTNSQDHRWLGNHYFRQQGAKIIAHARTVQDQKARLSDMQARLWNTVGEAGMAGTEPAYADQLIEDRLALTLGGVELQLIPAGQAHTGFDMFVWLPTEQIVFSGDIVYSERMLSVRPYSNSGSWIQAFERLAALQPRLIVPGHGRACSLDKARQDTYDYLHMLRSSVRELMDAGGDMSDIGKIDQGDFAYLQNFAVLSGRNAQQVYQELEWE